MLVVSARTPCTGMARARAAMRPIARLVRPLYRVMDVMSCSLFSDRVYATTWVAGQGLYTVPPGRGAVIRHVAVSAPVLPSGIPPSSRSAQGTTHHCTIRYGAQ